MVIDKELFMSQLKTVSLAETTSLELKLSPPSWNELFGGLFLHLLHLVRVLNSWVNGCWLLVCVSLFFSSCLCFFGYYVFTCCSRFGICWWNMLFLLESLLVSKSVEICRFLIYMVNLYRVGFDCLEVICELSLIWLDSHSTVVPLTFGARSYFLDYDGPITFNSRLGATV
jgi:hypothetical protein